MFWYKGGVMKTKRFDCGEIRSCLVRFGLAVAVVASCNSAHAVAAEEKECVLCRPGMTEALVPAGAEKSQPAAFFAAQEITNFLSRAFGCVVPIVNRPTPGKVSIALGTNVWSEAAGIDVTGLARDEFVISAAGNMICIAGRDDPAFSPFKGSYNFEHATIFGAYEFLERFAGCRFYFPGELGEIVPRQDELRVPAGRVSCAPDYTVREMSHNLGEWFETVDAKERIRIDRLQRYRLRHQTRKIPCCHGQYQAKFYQRFGATHPEYFRLKKDGTRWLKDTENRPFWSNAQMCHTSGIWEEIYKDARSYFLGEGPEVRGMIVGKHPNHKPGWGWQAAYRAYYDVMPQDGMGKCECANCQAAYAKAKDPVQYADELIWGHTVDVANRLKAEGIKGTITQMAYTPYRSVPEIAIPDNVAVMVCCNGPWVLPHRQEADLDVISQWKTKMGGNKVWLWNNTGKHDCFGLNIKDLPSCTPRAFGRYYRRIAPLAFGAFCSNNAERFLYSALNYYIYCKVSWDNSLDSDALIDEYYNLMFGAAAEPMRKFFDVVEDKWMNKVIGNTYETDIGTMPLAPSSFKVWTQIYPMKEVDRLAALMDEAAAAVAPGSLEARRVALMRREILEPMIPHAKEYDSGIDGTCEATRKAMRLRPSVARGFTPFSLTVTPEMTNKVSHAKSFRLDLKPGAQYRVTYFVKADGLDPTYVRVMNSYVARLYGGAQCGIRAGRPKSSMVAAYGNGMIGTFDWTRQTFTFTSPKEPEAVEAARIELGVHYAMGMAEFDGLCVEEL